MNVFRRRIKSPSSSQEVPSSALSNPWRIPICQMRKPRHESVSASWDLHPGLQEASQVALVLKNLPCQCRRSLAQEDPLEEGMATHSSILVWKIPWTEEPGGLQSTGWQREGHDWVTNTFTFNGLQFQSETSNVYFDVYSSKFRHWQGSLEIVYQK